MVKLTYCTENEIKLKENINCLTSKSVNKIDGLNINLYSDMNSIQGFSLKPVAQLAQQVASSSEDDDSPIVIITNELVVLWSTVGVKINLLNRTYIIKNSVLGVAMDFYLCTNTSINDICMVDNEENYNNCTLPSDTSSYTCGMSLGCNDMRYTYYHYCDFTADSSYAGTIKYFISSNHQSCQQGVKVKVIFDASSSSSSTSSFSFSILWLIIISIIISICILIIFNYVYQNRVKNDYHYSLVSSNDIQHSKYYGTT